MKTLKILRITTIKTDPVKCLQNMYDYSHFLFKHSSSFKEFWVIRQSKYEQIFFYKSKIFNFLPISPSKKFISIKKLIPKKFQFYQIYKDLDNGKISYLRCSMKCKNDKVSIHNELLIQVSDFLFFFKKIILLLINLRLHRMWIEDKEMLDHFQKYKDFKESLCIAKPFDLKNFWDSTFNKMFKNINYDIKIDV
jgi:hypothetical protein